MRNSRLAKAGGRMKQVAILSKASFDARKLASSGAIPAALYGEEAMGLPASFLSSLQNQMISASGMDPHAGCAAGMFEVAYGRRKDPWNIYLRDLVTVFYDVFRGAEGADKSGIVRTWALAARDVRSETAASSTLPALSSSSASSSSTSSAPSAPPAATCSTRWRKVSGTIGAVVNSLADLGWRAPSPYSLASPSGARFCFDGEAFDGPTKTRHLLAELLEELGHSVYAVWWARAGSCTRSAGLQHGADWRSYRALESKWAHTWPSGASMLRCIATDAFWTPARRWQAHVETCFANGTSPSLADGDFACPHGCGIAGLKVDHLHVFWTCPHIDVSPVEVSGSQQLIRAAARGVAEGPGRECRDGG